MTLRNALLSGLAAIVLTTSAACSVEEKRSGAEYNRVVYMPKECETPISAGSENRYNSPGGKGQKETTTNYDWIACEDSQGNVSVFRLHKDDHTWYSTRIEKQYAEKNF